MSSTATPPVGLESAEDLDISPAGNRQSVWKLALLVLPFGLIWLRLLYDLGLEWSTDPQYDYGWAVPWLCLGLLVRRWHRLGAADPRDGWDSHPAPEARLVTGVVLVFFLLAFFVLPTRLIEAATPEWRPIQWLLATEAVGLTLCSIYLLKGRSGLRQSAFPILFILVAIPWPTLVETPVIQGLSRFNAATVSELMNCLGVPAIAHGNVIEVSTGIVGIDDACSGIRSLQSSLMISLFWGEYYWLTRRRRWLLIPATFTLAMAFNICRTSILTFVSARKGTAAIAGYHDTAGLAILLACFATTWLAARVLRPKGADVKLSKQPESTSGSAPEGSHAGKSRIPSEWLAAISCPKPLLRRLVFALLLWLAAVEIGVELWYQIREARLKAGPAWSVTLPVEKASFKALPIPKKTRDLLRFDDGEQGQWKEADGTIWQAYYFDWLPGRVAGYLAKRHEPEICLPAVGCTLRFGPKLTMMNVHNILLPMRSYVFETADGPLNVYQCRWEAGASPSDYVVADADRYNLIRAVWAGRGKNGQKVLEIVVAGIRDPDLAGQKLAQELDKLITLQRPVTNTLAAASSRPVF